MYFRVLLFVRVVFILLEGDVFVEFGGAVFAGGNEVEADASDVLLGSEVLEVVDLFAFDLEFQQAEVLEAHLVAILQMTTDCLCNRHHQSFEDTTTDSTMSGSLFIELPALNGLVVNCNSLVFAECGQCGLGLFFDSVSHEFLVFVQIYIII